MFPSFHLPVDLTVDADCIFKMLYQLLGGASEWLWNKKSKTVENGPLGSHAKLARRTECKTVLVVGNDVKPLSPFQKNSTLHRGVPEMLRYVCMQAGDRPLTLDRAGQK